MRRTSVARSITRKSTHFFQDNHHANQDNKNNHDRQNNNDDAKHDRSRQPVVSRNRPATLKLNSLWRRAATTSTTSGGRRRPSSTDAPEEEAEVATQQRMDLSSSGIHPQVLSATRPASGAKAAPIPSASETLGTLLTTA